MGRQMRRYTGCICERRLFLYMQIKKATSKVAFFMPIYLGPGHGLDYSRRDFNNYFTLNHESCKGLIHALSHSFLASRSKHSKYFAMVNTSAGLGFSIPAFRNLSITIGVFLFTLSANSSRFLICSGVMTPF